jgi:cytochrome c553
MQGLSDYDIQMLYAWIDEIPLSRPKRNLNRDFSDGGILAFLACNFDNPS